MLHARSWDLYRRPLIFAAALLVATATALLLGCSRDPARDLHAVEVPGRPLVHQPNDPTTTFPESFSLEVAVYWSNHDESVLEMVHCLRGMGIPFFVTRDLDQALRYRLVILYPSVDERTFTAQQLLIENYII